MIEVLEPLATIPGVRMAVLVSHDGVPVVCRGQKVGSRSSESGEPTFLEENPDSLAGLAAGWLQGLSSSVAPLSWNAPQRVVLRAARGTLVMVHAPGSMLLVLLDTGTAPDELRLPMEGTVARMQRLLRRKRADTPHSPHSPSTASPAVPGAIPKGQPESGKGLGLVQVDSTPKPTPRQFPG